MVAKLGTSITARLRDSDLASLSEMLAAEGHRVRTCRIRTELSCPESRGLIVQFLHKRYRSEFADSSEPHTEFPRIVQSGGMRTVAASGLDQCDKVPINNSID